MLRPDLIIKNGNIYSLDSANTRYEAIAVKDGRIAALGSNDEIAQLEGPGVTVENAEGLTILPGFIDAHCHLLSLRGKQLLQVDVSPCKVGSIEDIVQALEKKASETPPGQWVLGGSYDYSKLEEKRHPTRWDLDRASTEHPLHLRSQTCHSGVCNSKALEIAGITRNTEDPPGGTFVRDASGTPTGVCLEEAHFLFVTGMGREGSFVPPYTLDEEVKAVELACKETAAFGITSVGDALVGPPEIEAYQEALRRGSLSARVYMIVLDSYFQRLEATGIKSGFGNSMLKIGGIKSFADGAIAAHTAWLGEPYGDGTVHGKDYCGIATKTPEETEDFVRKVHKAGYQIEIHANGDNAIDMVLTAYEKAMRDFPRTEPRHRIAHCTVVNPGLLERIKKLGVVVLPFSTYVWEHGEKMAPYGERIEGMFAHRSFLDYGIPVGGSSDNPCGMQDVLTAIQAMVTRQSSEGLPIGLSQRVSVEEALRIYTLGGAYASFEEKEKGTLEPGKLADMVFLSQNPFSVHPEEIRTIEVVRTMLGGQTVFVR